MQTSGLFSAYLRTFSHRIVENVDFDIRKRRGVSIKYRTIEPSNQKKAFVVRNMKKKITIAMQKQEISLKSQKFYP